MATKVTLGGQVYEWDQVTAPLSEALLVEKNYGKNVEAWMSDMRAGSATALAMFLWLVLRRGGSGVTWEQITSGEYEIDLAGFSVEDDESADPTASPAASPGTGGSTSPRSARSGSGPGKSSG